MMEEVRELPQAGETWRHFKGKYYRILTLATHTETREPYVVYKALYGDYADFVRLLRMFMSEVDREKYPDAGQKWRFEKFLE